MNKSSTQSQICAFITVLLWSTAYVLTPVALRHFSASSLGLLRCAVATACLVPAVAAGGAGLPKPADYPLFLASGAAGFALYMVAFNTGSAMLNPTTSCVIISLSPIITALLAAAAFKERLGARRWFATGLAFCGILVMCLWDGAFAFSEGLAWMLGAAVLISAYNILQRHLSRRYSALQVTAGSFLAGTLLLAGCMPEAVAQLRAASVWQTGLACFLGIFPSAAAYVLWSKALALAPKTSSVANYMFLTPFLALLLEYGILGALPGPAVFAGGGLILAGLSLFALAGKR